MRVFYPISFWQKQQPLLGVFRLCWKVNSKHCGLGPERKDHVISAASKAHGRPLGVLGE